MKYLRKFNESSISLIDEIKDRTIDLQDAGFYVKVVKDTCIYRSSKKDIDYTIEIGHKDFFSISEVIDEYLDHLVEFMKGNGYELAYGDVYEFLPDESSERYYGQEIYFYHVKVGTCRPYNINESLDKIEDLLFI